MRAIAVKSAAEFAPNPSRDHEGAVQGPSTTRHLNPAPSSCPRRRASSVEIEDTGKGMTADELAQAFTPFFTASLRLSSMQGMEKLVFGNASVAENLA